MTFWHFINSHSKKESHIPYYNPPISDPPISPLSPEGMKNFSTLTHPHIPSPDFPPTLNHLNTIYLLFAFILIVVLVVVGPHRRSHLCCCCLLSLFPVSFIHFLCHTLVFDFPHHFMFICHHPIFSTPRIWAFIRGAHSCHLSFLSILGNQNVLFS